MVPRLASALLDALAVLSPIDCAGCGNADRSLCDDCKQEIQPAVTPRRLADGSTVYTSLRYEGAVRQAVLALKESGRTDVAKQLGLSLAPALRRAAEPDRVHEGTAEIEFVGVPASRAAWRRRGYDPVALLARRAGIDVAKVLVLDRKTETQKTLGILDRAANLHESMSAKRSLEGRRFVLIDDVVTTGATISEAARAVRAAGGEVVGAAALAFTPRLFGGSQTLP